MKLNFDLIDSTISNEEKSCVINVEYRISQSET